MLLLVGDISKGSWSPSLKHASHEPFYKKLFIRSLNLRSPKKIHSLCNFTMLSLVSDIILLRNYSSNVKISTRL